MPDAPVTLVRGDSSPSGVALLFIARRAGQVLSEDASRLSQRGVLAASNRYSGVHSVAEQRASLAYEPSAFVLSTLRRPDGCASYLCVCRWALQRRNVSFRAFVLSRATSRSVPFLRLNLFKAFSLQPEGFLLSLSLYSHVHVFCPFRCTRFALLLYCQRLNKFTHFQPYVFLAYCSSCCFFDIFQIPKYTPLTWYDNGRNSMFSLLFISQLTRGEHT